MKSAIARFLSEALDALPDLSDAIGNLAVENTVERTRDSTHGDFASNLAMVLTRSARMPPRELAQAIIDRLPRSRQVARIEIAGPGFINFFVDPFALRGVLDDEDAEKRLMAVIDRVRDA